MYIVCICCMYISLPFCLSFNSRYHVLSYNYQLKTLIQNYFLCLELIFHLNVEKFKERFSNKAELRLTTKSLTKNVIALKEMAHIKYIHSLNLCRVGMN